VVGQYVNQLELIRAYLTLISAEPGSDRWHVVAYADEINSADRTALLALAGVPALEGDPERLGHFNMIHLSFSTGIPLLRIMRDYALKVRGPTELLFFGPSKNCARTRPR